MCGPSNTLLGALKQGVTIVMDQYAYSGAVQTAAEGRPGLDLEWAKVTYSPREESLESSACLSASQKSHSVVWTRRRAKMHTHRMEDTQ